MIFSSNTTALNVADIPMIEGYDCSYGTSLALVEAARNDFAVFKAMVQADYKEMAICNESTGVVQEGEIAALQEAVGGGIFKKIAELFRKLAAKIKSIFHNFMSKINALHMKDKDLVKKYWRELNDKRNLGKLEVKWRKNNGGSNSVELFNVNSDFESKKTFVDGDEWDRVKKYLEYDVDASSEGEYVKAAVNKILAEETTVKLEDIGGISAITTFMNKYEGKMKDMNKNINKLTSDISKLVRVYETAADKAGNSAGADTEDSAKKDAYTTANQDYLMAQAYQRAKLTDIDVCMKVNTTEYKQNKAAFMKAVAANDKKLAESAVLLNAIAEAAEEEVDNVIQSALSDEEISDLSAASTNVKDADVSDDPDKLTYGPDQYTDNASWDDAEGSIDTCIGGGKVEESAFFGKLFY